MNKSKRINFNRNCVKVRFKSYDENNFNITPKYSYIYNGVPGGWYV